MGIPTIFKSPTTASSFMVVAWLIALSTALMVFGRSIASFTTHLLPPSTTSSIQPIPEFGIPISFDTSVASNTLSKLGLSAIVGTVLFIVLLPKVCFNIVSSAYKPYNSKFNWES